MPGDSPECAGFSLPRGFDDEARKPSGRGGKHPREDHWSDYSRNEAENNGRDECIVRHLAMMNATRQIPEEQKTEKNCRADGSVDPNSVSGEHLFVVVVLRRLNVVLETDAAGEARAASIGMGFDPVFAPVLGLGKGNDEIG